MTASLRSTPHLYFHGTAEEALRFYVQCGLGEIVELRRYAETPLAERDGGAWRDKLLHAVLEGPGVRLCLGDGPDSEPMKGCSILLELDDAGAAERLFERLSAGGNVAVRFALQPFGVHYGNFTDRFGVQWAISVA